MIYLSQMVRRRYLRSYLSITAALLLMIVAGATALAALPSTTNYQLNSYGFGSGGTSNSSTTNYSLEGLSGEVSSQADSTSTYQLKPGFVETQQANVPTIAITNPSSYYDKLHFVINQQGNPSDALYAMQVCVGSDFTPAGSCSSYLYVKADNTLGGTLTTGDYQLYSAWGGAGGGNIIGLTPGTTYYVRAKATQGKFTESGYGPSSSAATSSQSISFCLFAGASCGSGSSTSFSGLVAGTPSTSSPSLGVTFDTNADAGGSIYIYSTGKLQSAAVPSGTINSATADLGSASQGYGAVVASSTSLTAQSPYLLSGNNVGILSTTIKTILISSTPVSGGSATINLMARASNTTPAATDYADTVTVIAAAQF
jgi:hypothetical protein